MSAMLRWFVDNPIAANLLMLLILIGGMTTMSHLDKEVFPQRQINQITVDVAYPGANPDEIESQILLRLEEALGDLDGIDEMRSSAREGLAQLSLDVASGQDTLRMISTVKSRVDAIKTFPTDAERPVVGERMWRSRMISLVLAGSLGEAELKALGERIREELAALPSVSIVELRTPRRDEIAIEVDEAQLRAYQLSFDELADAIRARSHDLPGGKLRTADGDVQIQSRGQAHDAESFENIAIRTTAAGGSLLLRDVATVTDGFEEIDIIGRYNGQASHAIDIYVTENPDVLQTSADVKAYVERVRQQLPEGATLEVWRDMSIEFRDRFKTLTSNGLSGLILVFLLLLLFLRPMLAAWVCVGIAVAFMGAIWLLPFTGTSLNLISLFAFIMILGIVVDDAIIVGEAIHTEQCRGNDPVEAAKRGALLVFKPVVIAVVSTLLFFAPFYFMPDEMPEPLNLANVVTLALSVSLIEALFILPAHLAHMPTQGKPKGVLMERLETWRLKFSDGMERFVALRYTPLLQRCLSAKGLTLAVFSVAFVLVLSVPLGGWMSATFLPRVPGNYLVANVSMEQGTPFSDLEASVRHIEQAAGLLRAELNEQGRHAGGIEAAAYENSVRVTLQLIDMEALDIAVESVRDRWRELIGPLNNVSDMEILYTIVPLNKSIELQVSARNLDTLRAASAELQSQLAAYEGVHDVRDSLENPLPQLEIQIKPHAEALGISQADVARQVRQAFYGEELQRLPRLREDVRVMLRYPPERRASVQDIHELRIRTADGREIPFDAAAEIRVVHGYAHIERVDRRRVATVSAEVQKGHSVSRIVDAVMASGWRARYPDVVIQKVGEQQNQSEFMGRTMQLTVLALILIYGLMAVVFRSYWQPVLIMSAIPFGFMGGLLGHIVLGVELAMFSMLGMVACAGVVVNDNLVLIDRINRLRSDGLDVFQAVLQGAQQRVRPILLTSLTTFVGLTPIMLETSRQAQFLKPMVVALAFGVAVASAVTLLFVPCLYLLGARIGARQRHVALEAGAGL